MSLQEIIDGKAGLGELILGRESCRIMGVLDIRYYPARGLYSAYAV
jgi:hypothetical protein